MKRHKRILLLICAFLLSIPGSLYALKTDRQQALEVNADATDGTLGDGTATLQGNVEIRQGTMLVKADIAKVEKVDGRVRRIELTGAPVHLQQEIEEQGLVTAEARKVEYEVATGIVTLTGAADVVHPQYHINGEVLEYDMNTQHFQGTGGDSNGRIRIQMAPEVIPGNESDKEVTGEDQSAGDETG